MRTDPSIHPTSHVRLSQQSIISGCLQSCTHMTRFQHEHWAVMLCLIKGLQQGTSHTRLLSAALLGYGKTRQMMWTHSRCYASLC